MLPHHSIANPPVGELYLTQNIQFTRDPSQPRITRFEGQPPTGKTKTNTQTGNQITRGKKDNAEVRRTLQIKYDDYSQRGQKTDGIYKIAPSLGTGKMEQS